ncbi:MAG: cyanophycin synthetase, partial [Fibrobacter sp.]|nr:cyanophycin synthetase [Fibrobacter sp.]
GAGTEFTSDGYEYRIKLTGEYQVKNAVMAIEAIKLAGLFDYVSVSKAIKNAYIPGRFEQVTVNGKKVIFDVGHNCQAAEMLKKNVKNYFENKKVCIVTGIMKDKDVTGVLAVYSEFADHVILTHPQVERAELPEKMLLMTNDNVRGMFSINGTVAGAVSEALSGENDIVCVCGSFYTVGEAFESLGIKVG